MVDETIDLDKDFKDSIANLSLDELVARLESMSASGVSKTGERHVAILRSRIEMLQGKPHTTSADLESINRLHATPVHPRTSTGAAEDWDKEFKESIASLSPEELQARIEDMEKNGTSKTGERHLSIMQERLKDINRHSQNLNATENKEKTHSFNAEEFADMYQSSQLRSGNMSPKDVIHYLNTLDEKGRKKYAEYQQTLKPLDPLRWVNPGAAEYEGDWSSVNQNLAYDQMARVAAMGGKSADNAVEIFNRGVDDMPPSYLWDLRQALTLKAGNEEANKANVVLENIVVDKAQQLADKKTALFDIDQTYALNDMLGNIKEHPLSPLTADKTEILDAVLQTTSEEIRSFEDQYGLANNMLQSPEIVEQNIARLAEMPRDGELFALDIKPEKSVKPSTLQSVQILLSNTEGKEAAPSISILAGALQCTELDDAQKGKLLNMALRRVRETTKLSQSEFKNFEILLDALETSKEPGAYSTAHKQKAMLGKARETYLKSSPLKEQQFQDIYNILNNMEVKGDLQLLGRKTIAQKGKESDIAFFMEQVRNETEMYLANTVAKGLTPKAFKEEYANRLRNNIVQLVYADKLSTGEITAKDFGKAFDSMAQAAQSAKPFKVSETSFIGYQAAKTNRVSSAATHLGKKKDYEKASKSFFAKIKATDEKLTKKYGTAYSFLKGGLKSFGWGTAYGLGAAFGPAGMAAVATASFANQAWGMYKDYKRAKEQNPNLSMWEYAKQNKLRMAGAFMSAASVVISGGNLGADATVRLARAGSGIALASAGAFHQASQAYRATKGNRRKKLWAATRAFGTSVAGFGIGMLSGRLAGEAIHTGVNHFSQNNAATVSPAMNYSNETSLNDVEPNGINPQDPLGIRAQMQEWNQAGQAQTVPEVTAPPIADHEPVYKPQVNEAIPLNQEPVYKDPQTNLQDVEKPAVEIQRQEGIGINHDAVNAQLNPSIQPLTPEAVDLPPIQESGPEIDVDKIKIHGDDLKIVGHEDGSRIVLHMDGADVSDIDKIKFHNDGSVTVRMENEAGENIKFRIGEDGKYDLYRVDGHVYTPEELEVLNSNPATIANNQENYQNLQGLRDSATDDLASSRQQTVSADNQPGTQSAPELDAAAPAETTQPAPEHEAATPAETTQPAPDHDAAAPAEATQPAPEHEAATPAETTQPAPEHDAAAPAEATQPGTQPAPEHDAATPAEATQPAPEHDAAAPAETTQPAPEHDAAAPAEAQNQAETTQPGTQSAPEADKPEETQEQTGNNQEAAQAEPIVHRTANGTQYNFSENGNLAIKGVQTNITHLLPTTFQRDAEGIYHLGSASSSDLSTAQKIETMNLQQVALYDQVYADLQNRQEAGETLGSTEQGFMQRHEQRLEENGLTRNEDGSLRRITPEEKALRLSGRETGHANSPRGTSGASRVLLNSLDLKTGKASSR